MHRSNKRRWQQGRRQEPRDPESIVGEGVGPEGQALEHQASDYCSSRNGPGGDKAYPSPWDDDQEVAAGLHGQRISSVSNNSSSLRRTRLFRTPGGVSSATSAAATKTTAKQFSEPSKISRFSRASAYTRGTGSGIPAVHIVCAISENMARETCVASLDAGSPLYLQVTKQGNGQTYSETLAYLDVLKPDEVLLNEGRRTSQLTRKILEFYSQPADIGVHPFLGPKNPRDPRAHRHQLGIGGNGGRRFRSDEIEFEEYQENEDDYADQPQYGPCSTSTVVKFISRACFDQTKGAELLRRLVREETYDASVVEEYILLSSSHAVLNYTQLCLGVVIASGCLFLSVNAGGNHRMQIDRSTLLHLELLVNSKTGKAKHSLIGTVDKTKTTVGSRLLRSNLMSPPTEVETINARLDLVDAFLSNGSFFYDVYEHLSHLPDMDKILSNIALIPRGRNSLISTKQKLSQTAQLRIASKGISALVCIKSCLSALPAFAQILTKQLKSQDLHQASGHDGEHESAGDHASVQTYRNSLLIGLGGQSHRSNVPLQPNELLRAIVFSMNNPSLRIVLNAVSHAFTPSTEFSRNSNAMRHQECFALKADEDGVVAILRKTFLANVDDIYKKADEYAEVHGMTVAVKYTASRGYFLSIPSDHSRELAEEFIQASISGRYIQCSTEEVNSLNMRSRENVHDLLVLTFERIQEVLEVARSHYDSLASLCDAVALLDMCHSFADTVSLSSKPWCRPLLCSNRPSPCEDSRATNHDSTIGDSDPNQAHTLLIRNGRFGIEVPSLGTSDEPDSYTPNDTFSGGETFFTTITGINGSGKSTYLKQLAIIVVLAHCGSYVPAEQASIPIRDKLCARIGTVDDQENNISTFMLEMKETSFICNSATDMSLILIDELGRATSNEDGVSIAWAVAEYLLKKRAMTFFVTHYPQLTRLADIYPAVQNIHMNASISAGERGEISYTHKAKSGACPIENGYGIKLAALCGWPSSVVANAEDIERQISILLPRDGPCESGEQSSSNALGAFCALRSVGQALNDISNSEMKPKSLESFQSMLQDLKDLHLGVCDAKTVRYLECLLYRDTGKSDIEDEAHSADDSNSSSEDDSCDTSSLSSSSDSTSDSSNQSAERD